MRPLVVAALVAGCLAAAACTKVERAGTAGHNAWTIPGTLRIAQREDPDNLNMMLGTETVDTDISMFWAGYLFHLDDRNELVPDLAVEVPTQENGGISRDGRSVTYHLRRNVLWHDGAPFNADDVIFSWQAILNPRNLTVTHFGYDMVTKIDKLDPYTIVVHLKHPFAPFVSTFFSMANQAVCLLPKHLLARYPNINRVPFNLHPVGTGPFVVSSYEPGSKIVFVANEHYWRGRPKLNRVEFNIIGSDSTMLTLMKSHAVDFFYRAPETMAASLQNIPGTRVVRTPLTRYYDIGFNAATPALKDVRVRQALAYATDRSALIDKVAHGIGVPAQSNVPPLSWAFNPNARQYAYDPKRAASLLDAAGWHVGANGIREKNGVPLALQLASYSGSATVTATEELLQAQWRDVGVDVSIKNFPSGQFYATLGAGGIEQSGKFDVVIENWANSADPDNSVLYACTMAPPAGWNIYHYCNPKVDALEAVALTHYDRATRRNAYATIQELLNEELPFYVLWYQEQFDVVNTDLQNYRPAHAVTPFWNTWEWSI